MSLLTNKRDAKAVDDELDKIQTTCERTNTAMHLAKEASEAAVHANTRSRGAKELAEGASARADDAKEIAKRATDRIDKTHDLASIALNEATHAKSHAIGAVADVRLAIEATAKIDKAIDAASQATAWSMDAKDDAKAAKEAATTASNDALAAFNLASPLVERIDAVSDEVKELRATIGTLQIVLFGGPAPDDDVDMLAAARKRVDVLNNILEQQVKRLDRFGMRLDFVDTLRAFFQPMLEGMQPPLDGARVATQGYVDEALRRFSGAIREEWSRANLKTGIVETTRKRLIAMLGGRA